MSDDVPVSSLKEPLASYAQVKWIGTVLDAPLKPAKALRRAVMMDEEEDDDEPSGVLVHWETKPKGHR